MTRKQDFLVRLVLLQIVLALIVVASAPWLVPARAQSPASEDPAYLSIVVLGITLSISIPTFAAGFVLKSAITAAISAVTERDSAFGKALVLVALGEALAIYGLIIALMLMQQLPATGV
nr:ATP synthase subunit C [Candidatus Sigynarchaeota archaeon]